MQRIDKTATLDDQAADLVAKCANAFIKDVSMRLVKLAKYRNSEPSLLDLKFTLKREYNMEFPQWRSWMIEMIINIINKEMN